MSSGIVLSSGYGLRAAVLVSERHFQQQHRVDRGVVLQSLHSGSVLRVGGSDVSDGSLRGGVFLRRRQLCGDAFQERVVSVFEHGELQGRHVLVSAERDGERHVSCGALLSSGQSRAGAVSGRQQLIVGGSDEDERLRSVLEGLLLSSQRHGVGDSRVLGGILLSVGNCGPDVCTELVVSGGILLSSGQRFAVVLCSGNIPRSRG